MFEVGAVRKTRRLTRICVVLGVILLFSSIGMTLTAAAPHENPPGQDQCDDGHGANDKPCKDDNEHGQDCAEHGNGGVNEDHCLSDGGTTGGSSGGSSTGEGTGGSSTGEGTGNATGNSTGGSSTGEGTGNATGNSTGGSSTGEGTGNATGNSTGEGTGNSTGNGTGNSTGNGTGNSTGEGTTGSTSGSSTGSTSGTSTGSPVVDGNNLEDEVLGRVVERKPLATTGNETTVLAVFGIALLMIGSFLRFGSFGHRVAVAAASPADELIVKSVALVERTVRPGSRNKRCD